MLEWNCCTKYKISQNPQKTGFRFIKPILEVFQSSPVWSGITALQRKINLNLKKCKHGSKTNFRLQRIIQKCLKDLNLETLKYRRNKLSASFEEKCVKHDKNKVMFKKNTRINQMNMRNVEKYRVKNVRTA